ncbi:MAG: hypothetical protein OXK17_01310 [Thaumarchaeota archaeon]|nr:hypothetical protein [Nitrososphaerota archaeon]
MDYDDRYFLNCDYSREELLEMQQKIMSLISSGSKDIAKDVSKIINVNNTEIQACLHYAYSKGLVDKERIEGCGDVPAYVYFAKSHSVANS